MVYKSLEEAKEDLKCLINNTNLLSNRISQLPKKSLNKFEKDLKDIDINSLKKFYNEFFLSLGYEELEFTKTVPRNCFPCFALVPDLGVVLVYEQLNDNSFKVRVNEEKADLIIHKFPKGSFFAILIEKKQTSKYSSAKQMFREIALKQKKVIFYLAVATFSINVLALGTSLYTMQVYDRVVPTGAISTLVALTIGVIIAMLLELIIKMAKSSIQDYSIKQMDMEYSSEIFSRFLKIRCDAMPQSVGTLTGQLQSYNSVRSFITNAATYLLIDLPFSLMFLAVIVIIGGTTMGLIPVVFLMLALLVGFLFKSKIVNASKNSSMASFKKTGLLVETVENSENIKATGASYDIFNKWNKLTRDSIDDEIIIKHYSEMSTFITQFLQQFSYITIVCVGAYLVAQVGELTMGSLIAMTILSGRVLQPIAQLPTHFAQWGKTKLAVDDLNNLYKLASDNENIQRPLTPYLDNKNLECKDIEFSYKDKNSVLKLSKLEIKQGEKVAILGPIGSGKSTLLKILANLYKPTGGTVYLNNIDMDIIKKDLINQTISYLPQNTKLLGGTLRDNLSLGILDINDEQIIRASKLTGLIGLINALPNGLDTKVPEGGESVSGGQKQLISLTRLLISNKDILLLDEPTASLDDTNERNIIEIIKQNIKKEQTLVVVTHKQALLEMVDRIVILTEQGVVMDGKKDDVLKNIINIPNNKRVEE